MKMKEFITYGFWGGISTALNLVLFYLMVQLGIPYLISNVISYALAVLFSYYVNSMFVFKGSYSSEFIKQSKFYTVRIVSILIDSAILVFLHEFLGWDLWISKIVDSSFIIGVTYIINKTWVFKSGQPNEM